MAGEALLKKNRDFIVNKMLDEYGYLFCMKCNKSRAYKFEVHHIIFRSERPNHKNLHDKDNLIICCTDCHTKNWNSYHNKKDERNSLVIERGLDVIFNISIKY